MAVFGSVTLTNKGLVLQGKAQAGAQLNYTRIAVGDGSLSGQSIPTLNGLISLKKSLPIVRIKLQPPNKAVITTTLSNSDITTGFYFREIGVYAQDPDVGEILYAYTNSGVTADFIAPTGIDIIEKSINIITLTAAAANVTATIASGIYASTDDLNVAVSNSTKITLSSSAPANSDANTWWYHDMGDSFDIGDGMIIGNASLDNTTTIFFDEI